MSKFNASSSFLRTTLTCAALATGLVAGPAHAGLLGGGSGGLTGGLTGGLNNGALNVGGSGAANGSLQRGDLLQRTSKAKDTVKDGAGKAQAGTAVDGAKGVASNVTSTAADKAGQLQSGVEAAPAQLRTQAGGATDTLKNSVGSVSGSGNAAGQGSLGAGPDGLTGSGNGTLSGALKRDPAAATTPAATTANATSPATGSTAPAATPAPAAGTTASTTPATTSSTRTVQTSAQGSGQVSPRDRAVSGNASVQAGSQR